MLRLILTVVVGFAVLVGAGAWYDPEGAREAIRRDLAELAGEAVGEAGELVREVAKQAAVAVTSKPAGARKAELPAAKPRKPKRPPVVASAPSPSKTKPAPAPKLAVEEIVVEEPAEFAESKPENEAAPEIDLASAPASGEPATDPPDVAARGDLIRRMLALYARVSDRR